jgi:hypothetical protein
MTNLPVPTPASEVPGNFITGALWNANVYNGLTFMLNPPLFVGYQASSQSLGNTQWVALAMDATAVDTYGGHSNVTNNTRYTAQVAGWYTVCGCYAISAGNSGAGFRAVRILVNGAAVLGHASYLPPNGGSETGVVTPTRDVYLNVGDYVEVCGWQSTGGSWGTSVGTDIRSMLYVRYSHA